jgi:hypothetical protein
MGLAAAAAAGREMVQQQGLQRGRQRQVPGMLLLTVVTEAALQGIYLGLGLQQQQLITRPSSSSSNSSSSSSGPL